MVLGIIVGAPGKLFGDIGPSVAMMLVHGNQNGFFIVRPFSLFQLRIQMIDKALATLLSLASRQVSGNLCPLSSKEGPFFSQNRVFVGRPRALALNDGWIRETLPLAQAVNGIVLMKIGGNFVPARCRVLVHFHEFLEQVLLSSRPTPIVGVVVGIIHRCRCREGCFLNGHCLLRCRWSWCSSCSGRSCTDDHVALEALDGSLVGHALGNHIPVFLLLLVVIIMVLTVVFGPVLLFSRHGCQKVVVLPAIPGRLFAPSFAGGGIGGSGLVAVVLITGLAFRHSLVFVFVRLQQGLLRRCCFNGGQAETNQSRVHGQTGQV